MISHLDRTAELSPLLLDPPKHYKIGQLAISVNLGTLRETAAELSCAAGYAAVPSTSIPTIFPTTFH